VSIEKTTLSIVMAGTWFNLAHGLEIDIADFVEWLQTDLFSDVNRLWSYGAAVLRVLNSLKNFVELFSIQGRLLVAILSLLCASLASAAVNEDAGLANFESAKYQNYKSAWRLTDPVKLTAPSVTLGPRYANPTYFMRLENGDVIELPPQSLVDLSGLSQAEVRDAADHTRVILEGVARLLFSTRNVSYAVVSGNYAVSLVSDQSWLAQRGLRTFDPLAAIGDSNPLGADAAEVVLPAEQPSAAAVTPQTARDRLRRLYTFFRDAIYGSTIRAFKNHRAVTVANRDTIQEWGFQIAFRGEFQIGIGKRNYTRNFPMMLSIGYNREKRTFVFRRGYRTETMADGLGMLAGWKIEFRRYRLFADGADAADPRPNYAKLKGTSWYPPSIPIFSPVADSAPGYQSEGFAIGSSIQNLLMPQTLWFDVPFALLNTVTSFEETQRVYSAAIPDPAAWMRRFHMQLTASGVFAGPTAAQRCEAYFMPLSTRRAR
jgi:hypothetical protein